MTDPPAAVSIWQRPERRPVGRPARHTRAEITAVALRVADAEGLHAVSMRRVAAELGTGAASLYRYVETRDELLDLMTDATAAEYRLGAPDGDWLAALVALGEQARVILRRHPWLAGLTLTRPVIGPGNIAVMEHFLAVLAGHPASLTAKLEAFALLNGLTATSVLYEQAGGPALQQRNVSYLGHAIASGEHPRLAELVAAAGASAAPPEPAETADRYPDLLARVLRGLLGAESGAPPPGR
jgi:AcrR family transcriptional regulator